MFKLGGRLLRRYSHVNWALADQAIISGVNFLTNIFVARYLGLEGFGRFTLAWMVVLLVNGLQHALITSPMMSIGPKQSELRAPAYFGAVIVQQLMFSVVVFGLILIGTEASAMMFPEWGVERLAFPLACAAFAMQFQQFLRRYFFTQARGAAAFASDAVRYLGQLIALLWLFQHSHGKIDSSTVFWVIAATTVAGWHGIFLISRIRWDPGMYRSTLSRHWEFSKWITASVLMRWTSGNLFTVAAGVLLGTSAVGALRAAWNLMGITHIFFLGLENVVPVRAARHFHRHGREALLRYLRRVALFGGLATAVMCMIAAALPDFWLRLVFGKEYDGYGFLVQWWAAIYLLRFFAEPLVSALRAIEQTRRIFWAQTWASAFTIVAAYPSVELLGLSGVVSGSLMVSSIMVVCLFFGVRRALNEKRSAKDY